MAVFFNEGLPGSGKSYEAMVRFIGKALREGRAVDAYIEGLNIPKIAEACELPEERVAELLRPLTRDQVLEFYKHARPNGLVVVDEAQDFWPAGRQKLDEATTRFITQHRHTGNDVLLMGQCLDDVHKLWRNRVKARFVLHKLDAVGFEDRYSVKTLTATSPGRFSETSFSPNEKYDPRWFGTYLSHVDDTIRTENYKDSRVSVWNNFFMKWVVPVSIVGAVWGGWTAYRYFSGHGAQPAKVAGAPTSSAPASAPAAAVVVKTERTGLPVAASLREELLTKYRMRLASYGSVGRRDLGVIEWWDGDKLRERLTFDQVRRLGITVAARDGIAVVADRFVTMWPAPVPGKTAPGLGAALPQLSVQ